MTGPLPNMPEITVRVPVARSIENAADGPEGLYNRVPRHARARRVADHLARGSRGGRGRRAGDQGTVAAVEIDIDHVDGIDRKHAVVRGVHDKRPDRSEGRTRAARRTEDSAQVAIGFTRRKEGVIRDPGEQRTISSAVPGNTVSGILNGPRLATMADAVPTLPTPSVALTVIVLFPAVMGKVAFQCLKADAAGRCHAVDADARDPVQVVDRAAHVDFGRVGVGDSGRKQDLDGRPVATDGALAELAGMEPPVVAAFGKARSGNRCADRLGSVTIVSRSLDEAVRERAPSRLTWNVAAIHWS